MSLFFSILLAALAESIVSFSGAFLAIVSAKRVTEFAHFVVSFAVGALLGVSFFELIPEAAADRPVEDIMPFVVGGIILFFVLEKFLFWYHCHDGQCPVHTYTYLILWGDFLHNLIDGVIIALTFLADPALGVLATIAVIFHEIPQEIGDFGLLLRGGFPKRKAIIANFLVSLATVAGALLTYAFGSFLEPFLPFALALIAGNFIYLATTDLMPELHEASGAFHTVVQIVLIVLGIIFVTVPGAIFEATLGATG